MLVIRQTNTHSDGAFPTISGKFEFSSSLENSGGQMLSAFRQCVADEAVCDKG